MLPGSIAAVKLGQPVPAVELADRGEQRLAGHDVDVDAGLLVVPVLVPERRQCASRTS
jgi:hypothetical protein